MNHIYDLFKPRIIIKKVGYEKIQQLNNNSILINTLDNYTQEILIVNTINYNKEEDYINNLMKDNNYEKEIIIYGKNCCDDSVIKKYIQLKNYGFKNIVIYSGGLFEWLLLQDIYGDDLFPTTQKTLDILKYKPDDN